MSTACAHPKGVLLYGPGQRQDPDRQAVARCLWRSAPQRRPGARGPRGCFLNIKGPELLERVRGGADARIPLDLRQRP
ncbi:hypothetical protein QJS66_04525 [Kocuria rhizophila]|nr:hypothetical protein QJS66_04525 [Kocuria rhizophila]